MCRSFPFPFARPIGALAIASLTLAACEDSTAPTPARSGVRVAIDGTAQQDSFASRFARGSSDAWLAGGAGQTIQPVGFAAAARAPGTVSPEFVVLPNAYGTVMGNSNNTFPHASTKMRYQQVFLESELAGLRSIGAVCLRRDQQFGGPAQTQQLTVKLGPTARNHTNLGAFFDGNYAAAPTTVFAGPVALPASVGGGVPNDFFICVEFTRSYVHVPGRNVLVEIVNTSTTSVPQYNDACIGAVTGCTTARAWAFSDNATVAVFVDNSGLVMRFSRGNPATKEDCKEDGWENYGFVNQGQCVRLIETGVDDR